MIFGGYIPVRHPGFLSLSCTFVGNVAVKGGYNNSDEVICDLSEVCFCK